MSLRRIKFLYPIGGLLAFLLLEGCTGSTYSEHFDCPMGKGAGCASISRVNKLLDRQDIPLGNDENPFLKDFSGKPCNGENCLNQVTEQPDPESQETGEHVYIYYGPNQLRRLIPTETSASQLAPNM